MGLFGGHGLAGILAGEERLKHLMPPSPIPPEYFKAEVVSMDVILVMWSKLHAYLWGGAQTIQNVKPNVLLYFNR